LRKSHTEIVAGEEPRVLDVNDLHVERVAERKDIDELGDEVIVEHAECPEKNSAGCVSPIDARHRIAPRTDVRTEAGLLSCKPAASRPGEIRPSAGSSTSPGPQAADPSAAIA